MLTAVKMEQLFQKDIEKEDGYYLDKALQKEGFVDENVLRQFFKVEWFERINVVFFHLAYTQQFTKDFIRQFFIKLTKDEKEYLYRTISDNLGCIVESLNPADSWFKYADVIADHYCYLNNVWTYIKVSNNKDCDYWLDDYKFFIQQFDVCLEGIKKVRKDFKKFEEKI